MKKVNIKIKGGKIAADFTGFQGKTCEALEQRIRRKSSKSKKKS
ncbi:hypothetical protein [Klebsiella pneumoniae]|nr:hypothetical protein [Klebsiella pneumoniae]MDV5342549.1 hypothetical protein [Klebsiella pneumoniae]